MVTVTEKGLGTGLAYVRLLLEERRQQLRALGERAPGHPSDGCSCRRSLEQAIDALEIVLRHAEEAEGIERGCQAVRS
jgi:hypothetical protein